MTEPQSGMRAYRDKFSRSLAGREVPLVGRLRRPLQSLPFPITPPTIPQSVSVPERPSRTGANFPTEWARTEPARRTRIALLETVVRPTIAGLAQPTVRGLDRLRDHEGPTIFASNHHSHVDTPLMMSSIPLPWRHRLVVGAAADYFFGTRFTATLSALVIGAIPIDRSRISRTATDLTRELIEDGWSLVVFPEGGRSPDGWGQPFRGGAAFISQRTSVPVVPIHIEGTGRILRKGKSTPTRSRTTVTFGEPMRCGEGEDPRAFNDRIEARVGELADEAMTDWWQARKRAHRDETPPLTGPQGSSWRRTWELDQGPKGRRGRQRRPWPR